VGRGRSRRPGAEPQKQTRKQPRPEPKRGGDAAALPLTRSAICRLAGASFGVGVGGEFPERVLARMSGSGSGSGSGGGGARGPSGPVPASARKLVQGLKEIVNRPDAEIYAALRECGMDPDEAVSRLLCQGSISCHSPFPHSFMCRLGR
jgi:hypothetical protein